MVIDEYSTMLFKLAVYSDVMDMNIKTPTLISLERSLPQPLIVYYCYMGIYSTTVYLQRGAYWQVQYYNY